MKHNHNNHIDFSPEESGHGTYKSYFLGFVLSIILTLASYGVVKGQLFLPSTSYITISVLALVQLLVQLIFFLHITEEKKPRLNLISFLFTLILIIILVGGSLWVMYNLNYNMM
jgi:cytochrome o ubiquinol oxidase operon protein cyoD